MRAVTFHGSGDVRVERVPDPGIEAPGDAIVRVEVAGLCGSDLHPYRGREVGLDPGTVMGHEVVGEVVETGAEVTRFRPGDRVVAPFTTSCGACFYCRTGLSSRCERGELLGWVEGGRGLHGTQAEGVRVPLADTTLVALRPEDPAETAVLAGDVAATGLFAALSGGVSPGQVVAVVGAGPVGLAAVAAARELGAALVFALDGVPERRALAEAFGAEALDPSAGEAVERLRQATGGRGADAVLEAVGTPEATRVAFDLARPGAVLASVGVHTEHHLGVPPGELYDKNLTYRAGRCPARSLLPRALALVRSGRYPFERIVSHRMPLAEGPRAYE
ncbi:MAG TPA: alcohol dehydrogenase catalytic domain-containing protein, partial [Thermoanaerobaculia bacterium]